METPWPLTRVLPGLRLFPRRSRHGHRRNRAGPLSEQDHQKQLYRAVIASTIGTTIEWYDFFLYSIVTGLVFAKLYFPNSEPLAGTCKRSASMP